MKYIKRLFILGIVVILFTIINNKWVTYKTVDKTFTNTDKIPKQKVGLLLGCSKYATSGNINLFYKYRIDAAVQLFKAGKIEYILVSGDNSKSTYDEPTDFKIDLIARGIPENRIFLDYAGFRTLDSVIRSRAIFGQTAITIISQKFHNERAIYIANKHNITAVGFNAKDVYSSSFREYLARVKMQLDLIFGKEPKFYGKTININ